MVGPPRQGVRILVIAKHVRSRLSARRARDRSPAPAVNGDAAPVPASIPPVSQPRASDPRRERGRRSMLAAVPAVPPPDVGARRPAPSGDPAPAPGRLSLRPGRRHARHEQELARGRRGDGGNRAPSQCSVAHVRVGEHARRLTGARVLRAQRTGKLPALPPTRRPAAAGQARTSLPERSADRARRLDRHRAAAVPLEGMGEQAARRRERRHPERRGGVSRPGRGDSAALGATDASRAPESRVGHLERSTAVAGTGVGPLGHDRHAVRGQAGEQPLEPSLADLLAVARRLEPVLPRIRRAEHHECRHVQHGEARDSREQPRQHAGHLSDGREADRHRARAPRRVCAIIVITFRGRRGNRYAA